MAGRTKSPDKCAKIPLTARKTRAYTSAEIDNKKSSKGERRMAKAKRLKKLTGKVERLQNAYAQAFADTNDALTRGIRRLAEHELRSLRAHYESALNSLSAARSSGNVKVMAQAQLELLRETVDRIFQSARVSLDILSDTRKELSKVMAKTKKSSKLKKLVAKVKSRVKKAASKAKKRGKAVRSKAKSTARKVKSKGKATARKAKSTAKRTAGKARKAVKTARKKATAAVKPVVAQAQSIQKPIVAAVAKPVQAVTAFASPFAPKPAAETTPQPTPPPSNPFKTE
jgi:histone H1/5